MCPNNFTSEFSSDDLENFRAAIYDLKNYSERRSTAFSTATDEHKTKLAREVNDAINSHVELSESSRPTITIKEPLLLFRTLEQSLKADIAFEKDIKNFSSYVIAFQHQLCLWCINRHKITRTEQDLEVIKEMYASMKDTMEHYRKKDGAYKTALFERLTDLLNALSKSYLPGISTYFVDKSIELYNSLNKSPSNAIDRKNDVFNELKSFIKRIRLEASHRHSVDFTTHVDTLIDKYNALAATVHTGFNEGIQPIINKSENKNNPTTPKPS